MRETLDEALAELAEAPPSEFTRARRALAERLTRLGQTKAATRLKAMRRPTVPVWVVNRLVREDREGIEQLIASADRMRAAQLGRGARPDALAAASAGHRTALARLTERAEAVLREAHLGAGHQVLLRIETTLAAAAADPELRPALRRRRLEHELEARGFEVFAGEKLPPPRRPGGRSPTSEPGPARGRARDGSRAEEAAKDTEQAGLVAARKAITEAEAQLAQQREQLGAARARVEELRNLLREATRGQAQAIKDERRATTSLQAARKALRTAERKQGA
jgi:hypothetical protein